MEVRLRDDWKLLNRIKVFSDASLARTFQNHGLQKIKCYSDSSDLGTRFLEN